MWTLRIFPHFNQVPFPYSNSKPSREWINIFRNKYFQPEYTAALADVLNSGCAYLSNHYRIASQRASQLLGHSFLCHPTIALYITPFIGVRPSNTPLSKSLRILQQSASSPTCSRGPAEQTLYGMKWA
ncbi:hypothetical protein KIN20_002567 [Parelaphostrongylus tenuis]|uniref:Uncharacterized protein n=1 Tax=Parelaphostrongylus tenuis TaxID=148309 RepID=A0AAD5QFG1_PARTN|nr:hypothetical protein KIN20_002567 [Parelaphostrongylus tenuis]